jgi:hypothetical protein
MPNTRYPVMGPNGRPSQPPASRCAPPPGGRGCDDPPLHDRLFIDEVVTGLELLAAQAEAALEAAHQDAATAEVRMLEAMALAPETPALQRTIIQLGLRDLLEKRACNGQKGKTRVRISRRRPGDHGAHRARPPGHLSSRFLELAGENVVSHG